MVPAMGTADELTRWTAARTAAAVAGKEVSPVEAVDVVLDRIARLNPALNAYCTVTADEARAAARRAESAVQRGERLGPLHGVPVSVKDTLWTAGVRTTMGSAIHADFVPEVHAAVVARLRAAGAIVVGKTATPEYAHKGTTDSPLLGATANPWSPAHTCGGSSGGAGVAVATGLGPLAVGTDEGGSIRIPASFCGLVGLKPTFGLVPRVPLGPAGLLTHLGPLARTVEDAALFLAATAGPDLRDGWSLPSLGEDYVGALRRPPGSLRVAWSPRLGYAAVDPDVLRVTGDAVRRLESLGWRVEEADPGFEDPAAIQDGFRLPGLAAALGPHLPAWRARMDPSLVALVELGQAMPAADVGRALVGRAALCESVERLFRRFDLLATPAVAVPPFGLRQPGPSEIAGRTVGRRGWSAFTYPFNLTGQPAIALPCGFTADGLPIGLQLVGRRFEDALVLRAAAAIEAAAPWADRWPPVDPAS
jgi:aspartyl-tRNA(Asn)/glutamyl-tRNA(Gln) amidotransferase subunit A